MSRSRTRSTTSANYLFGLGSFNIDALGKSAVEIAGKVGIKVPNSTKVILAPIDRVGIDEALSKEKLCPVLGFVRVPHVHAGISTARALIRMSGAGHSAAIHSSNPATILAYASAVKALARGRQCALQPGRRRLRHASGPVLHHRHRLLRPLLGRREYRAEASRELDPHRL